MRHTRRLVDTRIRWKDQRMLKTANQIRREGHAASTHTQHSWLDEATVTPPSFPLRPLRLAPRSAPLTTTTPTLYPQFLQPHTTPPPHLSRSVSCPPPFSEPPIQSTCQSRPRGHLPHPLPRTVFACSSCGRSNLK